MFALVNRVDNRRLLGHRKEIRFTVAKLPLVTTLLIKPSIQRRTTLFLFFALNIDPRLRTVTSEFIFPSLDDF